MPSVKSTHYYPGSSASLALRSGPSTSAGVCSGLIVAFVMTVIGGCVAPGQSTGGAGGTMSGGFPGLFDNADMTPAQRLISSSQSYSGADRTAWLIEQLDPLLANGDTESVATVVGWLRERKLPNEQLGPLALAESRLALLNDEPGLALVILEQTGRASDASREVGIGGALSGDLGLAAFDSSDLSTRQRAVVQYISAATRSSQLMKGFYARSLYEGLFSDDAFDVNRRAIWTSISSIDSPALQSILSAGSAGELPGSDASPYLNSTSGDQLAELRGWADLALRLRSRGTLAEYRQRWLSWQADWQGHSASAMPPAVIQQLEPGASVYPARVAVLLPGTGPLKLAADTIRQGFLAAYQQRFGPLEGLMSGASGRVTDPSQTNSIRSQSDNAPELVFFDTAQLTDLTDLFLELQTSGFDQVIGPLDKNALAGLAGLAALDPPVLGLNYIETAGTETSGAAVPPPGLFQFGLSMNDEIEQILARLGDPNYAEELVRTRMREALQRAADASVEATEEVAAEAAQPNAASDTEAALATPDVTSANPDESAGADGSQPALDAGEPDAPEIRRHRIALIYEDTPWAQRLAAHAMKEAGRFDIEIVNEIRADSPVNLSPQIANMLLIRESNNRRARLQSVVGKLEFEPRRRKDLDGIMAIATPFWLRQIKPLMAFHYARTLPLVSVSMAYGGQQDERKNSDMDSLVFAALPWVLDPEVQTSPLKLEAENRLVNPAYGSLFAMGADAFALMDKLELLTGFTSAYVEGYTGELSLEEDGRVRRTLPWGTFTDGLARMLPPTVSQ